MVEGTETLRSGFEGLEDYFRAGQPDASLLDIRRQACAALVLSRAGLGMDLPANSPLSTDAVFQHGRELYSITFGIMGSAAIEARVATTLAENIASPSQRIKTLIDATAQLLQELIEGEIGARRTLYTASDPDIFSDIGAIHQSTEEFHFWWERLLAKRENRRRIHKPESMAAFTKKLLRDNTSSMLLREDARLRSAITG